MSRPVARRLEHGLTVQLKIGRQSPVFSGHRYCTFGHRPLSGGQELARLTRNRNARLKVD